MSKTAYFDYAAATPLDPIVAKAMNAFYAEKFYNPSALYVGAREVKQALEEARAKVAQIIGARPSEVTFTAGGTESANLAIRGVAGAYPDGEILVSAVEHDAVLQPAHACNGNIIEVDNYGRVKLDDLRQKITDKTVLISVMYANNEVGTEQPVAEISKIVEDVRGQRRLSGNDMPLFFHTDACQASQYLDVNVARLGVDLMTLNGGKLFGPKQSGILYHRTGVLLLPQITGGGQELGLRSGTENVANCVGFTIALELAVLNRQEVTKKVREQTTVLRERLKKEFPEIIFNGHSKVCLPNTIHVTFIGKDNERMLFSLDDQGVFAAAGSACSASNEEASHVLLAMGISEADSRASLRFTLGKYTTQEDINRLVEALSVAVQA
jgi:cysteine desulfurase